MISCASTKARFRTRAAGTSKDRAGTKAYFRTPLSWLMLCLKVPRWQGRSSTIRCSSGATTNLQKPISAGLTLQASLIRRRVSSRSRCHRTALRLTKMQTIALRSRAQTNQSRPIMVLEQGTASRIPKKQLCKRKKKTMITIPCASP